jgi:hypothetical protein
MNPSRKWLARLFVGMTLLGSTLVMFSEPESLLHRTVDRAGVLGQIATGSLVFVTVLALIDVLINDLLPKKYVLKCAIRYRHTIYMLMSLGCLSMIFVIVRSHGPYSGLIHFGLVAWAAMLIAILDIRDRMKDGKK